MSEIARDNLTSLPSSSKANILVLHQDELNYTDPLSELSPRGVADVPAHQPSESELQSEIERLTVTEYTKSHSIASAEDTLASPQRSKNATSKTKSRKRKNKYVISKSRATFFSYKILL